MIQILAWLGTLWGRVALGAGVVVALVGLRAWDVQHQRGIGFNKAEVAIEKATKNATNLGGGAARKSASPGMLGKRDPSTRLD